MRAKSSRRRGGFSLVELVIVIVIIGVIAAIAIPRISRGAKGADESALRGNLAVLRSAIDMYAAEHGGQFPASTAAGMNAPDGTGAIQTEGALIGQLIMFSTIDGTVNATKDTANGFKYGPYLRKGIPPCPVGTNRGKTTVKVVAGTPTYQATGEGWVYSYDTGEVIANCADTDVDEAGVKYNTY
jgi:prepilin-type N-terminal cleavage/methylation domain-containing protein